MKSRATLLIILLCLFSFNLFAQSVDIIPQPNEIKMQNGVFQITPQTSIISNNECSEIAVLLKNKVNKIFSYNLKLTEQAKPNTKTISLKLNQNLKREAYELLISENAIEVYASNTSGWFYGVQSLTQLLYNYRLSREIPAMVIKDSPRFPWRAFMLDEARYFKGMNQVKILLDEMAYLKMNVFHWHLVDDQGWRIEIKKYPRLTEVGSKRKSTQIGPLKWQSPIQSAEPHEGFYTQEQIKEIIEYAKERQITIVPEIEMPGHSSAAIAAYPWLGTAKKKMEVPIKFGISKDVYDISDPKVYKFLTDVLDEVMSLFPSEVIHIGGDEVKYDHWKASESIQAYMTEKGISSPVGLQIFFTNRISNYLQAMDRRMMGWNEILGHKLHEYQDEEDTKPKQQLAKESLIHFWKGDVELATSAASQGYEIINSLHSETYLDYDYNSIPLSRAYNFDPIPKGLAIEYHNKVVGTGCQMWGEWIPTNGHMHFQVFPRIAAYAEVGWTDVENKDFSRFQKTLTGLQKQWSQKGIYYAPKSATEKKIKK